MVKAVKKLNILFLGGAKRVSIGRMFIATAERKGLVPKIFSYELENEVPISLIGEVIIGKKWSDPEVLSDIHRVVNENEVNLLVPFVDGAVEIAAAYKEKYGDAWASVSSVVTSGILFDKVRSAELFEELEIPIPATYKGGEPIFPLIAKPRKGSASKGIKILQCKEDLDEILPVSNEYLIQECIYDKTEYTVDCYISKSGEALCVSPRVRLEVVGGEVSKTITVDNSELLTLAETVLSRLGVRGAVTLQFIRDNKTGRLMLMEINPRLGGGAICTVYAGGNIPEMIIDECCGNIPQKASMIKPDVMISRYFDEAVFYG
ncbi:MAG: ATP-grasp domain-containing protein [Duncaniella sp.]|nr:ATP-grasp domain-containing protein [Muribaculum sp.]MCM1255532.1 ATP-grasp domain-containing protein [Duncaniella sp.]